LKLNFDEPLSNFAFHSNVRHYIMVQPPADDAPGAACIAHYTWGAVFHQDTKEGPEVWRWDKREYASGGAPPSA
jgi:hypothetical protein